MKANVSQLRAALDNPASPIRLYVLHGPDEAGAREWAARLARTMGPDAERIDIEASALRTDPGLLAGEAASLSLFGGARHIRVTGAGEECLDAFALLLAAEQAGNPVIALAPSVKATGKMLKLVQGAANAMSFACYLPEGADAERLVTAMAMEHGLRASGDTARRIATACGTDRAVMAREIEKFAQFLDAAPERPKILDDAVLDALGADSSDAELGRAIAAAVDGRPADLGLELARLAEAGTSPIPLMRGVVRRLMTIAELRAEVDAGASIDSVIERHRIFFRERGSTARALRTWNPVKLAAAIDHARKAERGLMGTGTAGQILAERACIDIARSAARRG